MALNKITYEDKETLNPLPSVADKNKVTDDDMNEIKSVVNGAIDQVEANTIPQQANAPDSPSENDLWIDTDDNTNLVNIDDTPSTTSTNPIQNQAITNYVNDTIKTKITTLWSGSKNTTGNITLSDNYNNYDLIAISVAAPTQNDEQVFFIWKDGISLNAELNYCIYQKTDVYASASCSFTGNTTFNIIKFSTTGSWSNVWIKSIKGIKF